AVLQHGVASGGGHAAAGGVHVGLEAQDELLEVLKRPFTAAGRVPGISVMAVLAAHRAALEKQHHADARAVDGSEGLNGVQPAGQLMIVIQWFSPIGQAVVWMVRLITSSCCLRVSLT